MTERTYFAAILCLALSGALGIVGIVILRMSGETSVADLSALAGAALGSIAGTLTHARRNGSGHSTTTWTSPAPPPPVAPGGPPV